MDTVPLIAPEDVDATGAPQLDDAPPLDGTDTRPSRPTTRAGRARARQERAAARSSTKADKAPARKAPATSTAKTVATSVENLHSIIGSVALPMASLPTTGLMLVESGKPAGEIWAQLAVRYPVIAKVFTSTGDGALFAQLLMVYYPVIMAMQQEAAMPKEQRAAMAASFSHA